MAKGWHERRFEQRAGMVHKTCGECGRDMWLPPSKAEAYHRCGPQCNDAWRAKMRRAAERNCETCGKSFWPRPSLVSKGHGRYCSQKCNKAFHIAGQRPEVWEARVETMRQKRKRGEWTVHSGPANWAWRGGLEAHRQRRRESGKEAEAVRRYRAKNKDKVREFTARRKGRKLGRLEYGTIPRLRRLQRDRCAICRKSISDNYTVDHIIPLARGGEHKAANIQLLCPSCNFRKSSRDPIEHMQSLGRLL